MKEPALSWRALLAASVLAAALWVVLIAGGWLAWQVIAYFTGR